MADYISNIDLLLKHFDYLYFLAYPNDTQDHFLWTREKAKDGVISISSLLELAICIQGKIDRDNSVGKDFIDHSDAKSVSVRTSSYGKRYSAPVTNIHRKKGLLRVCVYERKKDKFYHFVIPYLMYKNVPKTSNIEIPFELDGTPKIKNKAKVNWWEFKVNSFQDLCVVDSLPIPVNISSLTPDSVLSTKNLPNLKNSNLCTAGFYQQQSLDFGETQPIDLCD